MTPLELEKELNKEEDVLDLNPSNKSPTGYYFIDGYGCLWIFDGKTDIKVGYGYTS